jgi:hypothetical protein
VKLGINILKPNSFVPNEDQLAQWRGKFPSEVLLLASECNADYIDDLCSEYFEKNEPNRLVELKNELVQIAERIEKIRVSSEVEYVLEDRKTIGIVHELRCFFVSKSYQKVRLKLSSVLEKLNLFHRMESDVKSKLFFNVKVLRRILFLEDSNHPDNILQVKHWTTELKKTTDAILLLERISAVLAHKRQIEGEVLQLREKISELRRLEKAGIQSVVNDDVSWMRSSPSLKRRAQSDYLDKINQQTNINKSDIAHEKPTESETARKAQEY